MYISTDLPFKEDLLFFFKVSKFGPESDAPNSSIQYLQTIKPLCQALSSSFHLEKEKQETFCLFVHSGNGATVVLDE